MSRLPLFHGQRTPNQQALQSLQLPLWANTNLIKQSSKLWQPWRKQDWRTPSKLRYVYVSDHPPRMWTVFQPQKSTWLFTKSQGSFAKQKKCDSINYLFFYWIRWSMKHFRSANFWRCLCGLRQTVLFFVHMNFSSLIHCIITQLILWYIAIKCLMTCWRTIRKLKWLLYCASNWCKCIDRFVPCLYNLNRCYKY